ncbi:MAG: replication-associated recombination protein A [Firmicutes bacterium]|nr:replication-associated recombination protein A [Bacillota bacterium]
MAKTPLADRIRPNTLDDVVGQRHLIGEGKILRNIIEKNEIPNMIFYGPSGVGKTTIANIIASRTGKTLKKLNATTASVTDIRDITASLDSFLAPDGVLLYLDEIQNFNKKQQQSLLEFMENGKITLIASTTENPYFYIYNAVLSRSLVFEFLDISADDIETALKRAVEILSEDEYKGFTIDIDSDALTHLAQSANGDVRKALNSLEAAVLSVTPDKDRVIHIDIETAEEAAQKKSLKYDKDGDSHYNILSAFQKSIRGSDPDAAIHYLARLIAAGDLISICRRLQVIAAEDIGLAYPQAISIVNACVAMAERLGLPEARIPLADAVILLVTAPKSNSGICAIDAALSDIEHTDTGDIPKHLKDSHYGGSKKLGNGVEYKYPHSYENHYVKQQYLPDNIVNKKYYKYGNNKTEMAEKAYWDRIKGEDK